jgi:hypothetical protein
LTNKHKGANDLLAKILSNSKIGIYLVEQLLKSGLKISEANLSIIAKSFKNQHEFIEWYDKFNKRIS